MKRKVGGPLHGVKVLDVGAFGVGPVSCGLLGQLGAEVIRIEPHTGDGLMFIATMVGGMGACYIGANFNKKNIVLNLHQKEDRKIASSLLKWADVVIENRRVGTMEKLGFDYASAIKLNPGLIYVSSPAYGTSGPFTSFAGADHYLQAASAFVQLNGRENGDPEIFRFVAFVDQTNSSIITLAVLVALLSKQQTGRGQYINTSSFNGAIALQSTYIAKFLATNTAPQRMGSADPNIVPSQAFPTLDKNYVLVSIPGEEYWSGLCQALEIEKLQNDPRFCTNARRVEHRAELVSILEEKFRDKPRRWWLIHLARHGIPCGYVAYYEDVIRDPHILDSRILVEKESPWGKIIMVNAPWQFSRTPIIPVEVTHTPDSDRKEILKDARQTGTNSEIKGHEKISLPLKGIKVVDLSTDIAGAYCSMSLADAGAEVLKVDIPNGHLSRHVGPTIDGESALFLALNRNKKSIAIDYTSRQGRDIIFRLIESSDILIGNLTHGKRKNAVMSYKKLQSINPRLIYCGISPFGENGPYKDRPASELELQGISGLMQFLGEPGEAPVRLGADAIDIATGIHAAAAIIAALYERKTSGKGQKIGVAKLDVALWIGSPWIWNQCNPDFYGGYFQTGPYDHAETGYKAKDKSIMFGLFTNTEERALQTWDLFCHKLGIERLLRAPYFAEHGPRTLGMGREAQEMKPLFESAFKEWKADDLVSLIQSIGGMGATFMTYEELYGEPPHPQVQTNEMIWTYNHPKIGRTRAVGVPYKLSETPLGVRLHSPLLGEHTEETLHSLGYHDEEILKLVELGIVGNGADSS